MKDSNESVVVRTSKPLFALGEVVMTSGVVELIDRYNLNPEDYLNKHVHGDWHEMGEEHERRNLESVQLGLSILSSFTLAGDFPERRICVMTQADRSVTTLFLPMEY